MTNHFYKFSLFLVLIFAVNALASNFCRPFAEETGFGAPFGDLTSEEITLIQGVVDVAQARRNSMFKEGQVHLYVVGSAARGQRRRGVVGDILSDIDYVISREFLPEDAEGLMEGLNIMSEIYDLYEYPGVPLPSFEDGFHVGNFDATLGPGILFRTGLPPEFIPQSPSSTR